MTRSLLPALLAALMLTLPGCGRVNTCVSQHSMIWTPGGETRAAEIETGYLVTSLRPDGSLSFGRVTAIRHGRSDTMLTVTLGDGRELWVTPEHPIGLSGAEFVPAGRLEPGDTVRTGDADATVVRIVRRRGDHRVVDLTVEPDANFFANGVLVHNKMKPMPLPEPTASTLPGRYVSIATGTTIELTDAGGRLFIPKPAGNGHLPEGDSVWDIGPWTLDEYTMTAPLSRRHHRDWLSLVIAEDEAMLVIRAIGTTGPTPARPDRPPGETILRSVRIETPSRVQGLGGAWTTPAAIERALRGFEAVSP
jgi:hypothetical protein